MPEKVGQHFLLQPRGIFDLYFLAVITPAYDLVIFLFLRNSKLYLQNGVDLTHEVSDGLA